jgi:hypothetical protein
VKALPRPQLRAALCIWIGDEQAVNRMMIVDPVASQTVIWAVSVQRFYDGMRNPSLLRLLDAMDFQPDEIPEQARVSSDESWLREWARDIAAGNRYSAPDHGIAV